MLLPPTHPPTHLPDQIHHEGGTILGSSRGGFDIDKIIGFLEEKRICQLFIIGGDGTHRGANTIGEVGFGLVYALCSSSSSSSSSFPAPPNPPNPPTHLSRNA